MGRRTASRHLPYSRKVGGYTVLVSEQADEPAWDDFLEKDPYGHHAQTSAWGRARASIGWLPVRVVVSENGRVVAGGQMVTRPMPFGGDIGFVHRGPVVPEGRPDLAALVFAEMLAIGKARKVRYLVVQPPPGAHWMTGELTSLDFRYGAFDIDHTSTLRLDLSPDLDTLLADMAKKCRQYVRKAAKTGLTVRRGSEADLPIFNHLKDLHSARLGYPRRAGGYYEQMWRALAPRGHIGMFVAEYEGEPIVAQLVIPFGEVSRHMERTWSGTHAELRPNETIEWEAIKWAKSEGYRFTDFEGIERPLADMLLAGTPIPEDTPFTASLFKTKFGGHAVIDPSSYDYVYNPVLRFAYHCIPVGVMRSPRMRRLLFMFRETGS